MIIYKITDTTNGKIYIGKHCGQSDQRWKQHLKNALDNTRPEHLYRAMNLRGIDNFEYEVLENHPLSVGDRFLNEREKFYIKKYNSRSDENGYNMTEGGEGITAQFCTTSTKTKMSDSLDQFDYASYSCLTGKLLKVFDKRSDIQIEYPQIKHVRHVNHACNANDPFFKGKKYSGGAHPAGMFMWIKLPNGSNFPEKIEIVPSCKRKVVSTRKKSKDGNEISQYTLSGQLIGTFPNVVTQIAREIGTEYSSITNAINGKSTSHMGFLWRLYPENKSPQRIEGIKDSKKVTFTKKQITQLPIVKKLDGVEVDRFKSAIDSILKTDMKPTELFGCLNDGTEDSNGFSWSWS